MVIKWKNYCMFIGYGSVYIAWIHVNQLNLAVLIKIKMTIFYNQDSKSKTFLKQKSLKFLVLSSFLINKLTLVCWLFYVDFLILHLIGRGVVWEEFWDVTPTISTILYTVLNEHLPALVLLKENKLMIYIFVTDKKKISSKGELS